MLDHCSSSCWLWRPSAPIRKQSDIPRSLLLFFVCAPQSFINSIIYTLFIHCLSMAHAGHWLILGQWPLHCFYTVTRCHTAAIELILGQPSLHCFYTVNWLHSASTNWSYDRILKPPPPLYPILLYFANTLDHWFRNKMSSECSDRKTQYYVLQIQTSVFWPRKNPGYAILLAEKAPAGMGTPRPGFAKLRFGLGLARARIA